MNRREVIAGSLFTAMMEGAQAQRTQFIANPHLFADAAAARAAIATWPLQPAHLINSAD